MTNTAASPYAAPASNVDDVPANPEADAIRRAHISHEASIKSVGILYYLGGVLVMIGGITGVVSGVSGASRGIGVIIGAMLLVTAIGAVALSAGWGVRALRPWGRNVGAVLSVIGLLNFPAGTLINGYILYLYFSKKGRTIFGPGYRDIVAATPDVKYRTPILVWIVLALLLGLAVFTVIGSVLGK